MSDSTVSVCLLYPDLLGTYGDGGNATVLSQRLSWRGISNEIVPVNMGDSVPESCDIYLLGGGEDQPQSSVTDYLQASGALHRAVARNAVVLAVCAGMQVLGESFAVAGGKTKDGLGLLDVKTVRGTGTRCVGELQITTPLSSAALTGYENHGGATHLGAGVEPLGTVVHGRGNDDGNGTEGAISGRIVGTYMHGPFLARNAWMADHLLSWIVGDTLTPLEDGDVEELRQERFRFNKQSKVDPHRTLLKKVLAFSRR